MTLRKIGPGLLCALLLPWGDSASAQPLDEAAANLLASHPQIRAGEANVLAAEDGVQRALAGYLPRVNLNGRYAFENIDSPARRQIQGEASNMPAQNASVTITQNLFDGFRTQAEHESASINVQFTEAELESTRQAVLFEGVTAYLDVLRRRRQVALALSKDPRERPLSIDELVRIAEGSLRLEPARGGVGTRRWGPTRSNAPRSV